LLGHEFEHAAEQAEGLNLRLRAAERNSHVHRLEDGSFETDRAVEAGRVVARECWSRKGVAQEVQQRPQETASARLHGDQLP
jgi:hypothetical protein